MPKTGGKNFSVEMFEGLSDDEIMEAFGDDIKRAATKVQRSKALGKWWDSIQDEKAETPELTQAQQAYFDKTGKLPKSAQTK